MRYISLLFLERERALFYFLTGSFSHNVKLAMSTTAAFDDDDDNDGLFFVGYTLSCSWSLLFSWEKQGRMVCLNLDILQHKKRDMGVEVAIFFYST